MRLHRLFPALRSGPDAEITGLSADSRRIKPGMLFAAMKGSRNDGRAYIDQALQRGAVAILTDRRPGAWPVPVMKTDTPRAALARAAAEFHEVQPATIIAVTGTNGKSSTVDFLRQIWRGCGHRSAALGTLGVTAAEGHVSDAGALRGMTTPDAPILHEVLASLAGADYQRVAIEASSHGLAQDRVSAVRLSGGIFTNLTRDHLDYHADFDDYRCAKLKLFAELLPEGAPAVINLDDPSSMVFERAAHGAHLDAIGVGRAPGADLRLRRVSPRSSGQAIEVHWRGRPFELTLPLVGAFQAENAMLAAAMAVGLGDDWDRVRHAVADLRGLPGRMQRVGRHPCGAPAYVDYAHTPAGMVAALQALRAHISGRLICVFGCGGDRDPGKRAQMGEVADRLADTVIVTDDNPRGEDPALIRGAIRSSVSRSLDIADRAEAIAAAAGMLLPTDALLILGKGHETGQTIGDRCLPFDDAEVVRAALAEAAADGKLVHG